MQHMFRVRASRSGGGLSTVYITAVPRTEILVSSRDAVEPDDVPGAILAMLTELGERFVASMPDFGARHAGSDGFFAITESLVDQDLLNTAPQRTSPGPSPSPLGHGE
jgi:hypothetical protein